MKHSAGTSGNPLAAAKASQLPAGAAAGFGQSQRDKTELRCDHACFCQFLFFDPETTGCDWFVNSTRSRWSILQASLIRPVVDPLQVVTCGRAAGKAFGPSRKAARSKATPPSSCHLHHRCACVNTQHSPAPSPTWFCEPSTQFLQPSPFHGCGDVVDHRHCIANPFRRERIAHLARHHVLPFQGRGRPGDGDSFTQTTTAQELREPRAPAKA